MQETIPIATFAADEQVRTRELLRQRPAEPCDAEALQLDALRVQGEKPNTYILIEPSICEMINHFRPALP